MITVDDGPVPGLIDDDGPVSADSDHVREWDTDKQAAYSARLTEPQVWIEFHFTTAGVLCYGTVDHVSNTTLRHYRPALMNVPEILSQLADQYYGVEQGGSITLTLSDIDNGEDSTWAEITAAEEIRGQAVNVYSFNEDDGATFEFRGEVKSYKFQPGVCVIEIQYRNEDILQTIVPQHVVTTDLFDETAISLGESVPICLGRCRDVPLRNIQNDLTNDEYDYLIGYGTIDSVWSTPASNMGVKRNGVLVDSSEYTFYDGSQVTPYSGYAFLRFTTEQKDFSGGFHELTADVYGMELGQGQVCRNPIRQIRYLLNDSTYGLNESINSDSFDDAATAIDGITNIYSDGSIVNQRAIRDYIDKLLAICRARLWKNNEGEWCIHVDRNEGVSGVYTDGVDCEVMELSAPSSTESIKSLICRYAHDRTNDDRPYYEMTLAVNSGFGSDKVLDDEMMFVLETATAKKAMSYIRNRHVWDDSGTVRPRERIQVKIGVEGKHLDKDMIITITSTLFGLSSVNFKITGIRKTAGEYVVDGYRHDSNVYADATISSPTTVAQTSSSYGIVVGEPWFTVSPTYGVGKYQTIQAALNDLPTAGGRIALLKGNHVQTDVITVPDKDVYIEGENLDQVVVKNKAGSHLWVMTDLTKKFEFQRFKIASQNSGSYSRMFSITGTGAANNTAEILIRNIHFSLIDLNTYASAYNDGDFGVYAATGQGYIRISDNCYFNNAPTQVYMNGYSGTAGRRVLDILNCKFNNPTYSGVLVDGGTEWCITGCRIEDFWQNGVDGINTPGRAFVVANSFIGRNDSLDGD